MAETAERVHQQLRRSSHSAGERRRLVRMTSLIAKIRKWLGIGKKT
jgi:hypothetical protein